MKIAVGSQNPVKIESARRAFKKAFENCEVVGVSVSSGVSDMPMTFEETVQGAKNRAKEAIKKNNADFGVGLEGGFDKKELGMFLIGFVAVIDKEGKWGYGERGGILIPESVVRKVKEGKELGDVMDEITGEKNTKQREGAIGFFTKGLISRTESFEAAVIQSLAKFFRPEMYD